jgi:hypothetical protein
MFSPASAFKGDIMPDLITERDPFIAHSYLPTHPRQSTEYLQVLHELEIAYQELIQLVDACEACGVFDNSQINKAKEKCISEEKRKDEMYDRFFG